MMVSYRLGTFSGKITSTFSILDCLILKTQKYILKTVSVFNIIWPRQRVTCFQALSPRDNFIFRN